MLAPKRIKYRKHQRGINKGKAQRGNKLNFGKYIKRTNSLVVFFEQGHCHACDLLHSGPLSDDKTITAIQIKKCTDSIVLNICIYYL